MRIRISHEVSYTYAQPVRSVTKVLRVMPRDHEGQVIVSWRIEPSVDGRLRVNEDAFGNRVHQFQADGPLEALAIRIEGIVETTDTTGFVRGAADPVPAQIYLRDTPLTQPDEAMLLFSRKLDRSGKSELEQLHMLMGALHQEIRLDAVTHSERSRASEAFERRSGSVVDLVHVFCGCARELGMPARIVNGYLAPMTGTVDSGTAHCWAEVLVPAFGWIGFDAALDLCPGDRHVRIAVGIDQTDVAPFRQATVGGGGETAQDAVFVATLAQ